LVHYHLIFASVAFLLGLAYVIGAPLAKCLEGEPRMRWLIAPLLGLGASGAIASVAFHFLPLNLFFVLLIFGALALMARGFGPMAPEPLFRSECRPSALWVLAAVTICLIPAAALVPQKFGAGYGLAYVIFDHAKVAIIDEIAQNGLPPHNPFFSSADSSNLLVYYYIWYFVAGCVSVVTGASGWEVDVALTFVTALLSVFLVAWIATSLSRRWSAAWWALLVLVGGSPQQTIEFISGPWLSQAVLREYGLDPWISQSAWAPQHLFGATVLIASGLLLVRLFARPDCKTAIGILLGLMVATASGASIYAGGFGAALALPLICLVALREKSSRQYLPSTLIGLAAAMVGLSLAAGPLLSQQFATFGGRRAVDVWMYPVLAHSGFRNLLAYWLVLLPLKLGVVYLLAIPATRAGLKSADSKRRQMTFALVCLAGPALLEIQFLHSVIAGNDLGWRLVLVAVLALAPAVAAFLARSFDEFDNAPAQRLTRAAVAVILIPALIDATKFAFDTTVYHRLYGPENAATVAFPHSPELWRAVQAVTPSDEAIANNPLDSAELTLWPDNISWALFGHRRNCAASLAYLRAYGAPKLSWTDADRVNAFFVKVFGGEASAEDLVALKETYLCRTLVVTPLDGLWNNPILANNPTFKLVDERQGRWRLYR